MSTSQAFSAISSYVTFCIEDQNTVEYLGINSNCSSYCFKDNKIIDYENKKCRANCTKYEYNNICYDECPENTYPLFC